MSMRLIAAQYGATLWRNNSGAWFDPITGRTVRYGLGNDSKVTNKHFKSSDWIGIGPNGRFIAIEEKPEGWIFRGTEHEKAQLNFIECVRAFGGIAGFATSETQVAALLTAPLPAQMRTISAKGL